MKRIISLFLSLLLLATLAACATEPASEVQDSPATEQTQQPEASEPDSKDEAEPSSQPYEVTDLLGRTVTIPAETSTYACIGPGALRLYCYVADRDALVGIENMEVKSGPAGRPYAMSLENLSEMTIIGPGGPGNAPDAELLYAAAPDVIFSMYNSEAAVADELQEKTGIPVVVLSYGESEVFDQAIYDSMTLIGQVTGHEDRAAEVVAYMQGIEADLNQRTADIADRPLVYFGCQSNQGSHGIESTVGNYVLFEALNIRNAIAEAGVHQYAVVDKEQILELDPDAIVIDAGGYEILKEDYAANPDLYEALTAVREGKVYMQMPYNWYYTNLEIALADAYYIGSVIYSDAFSDVVIEEKFDEISNFMLGIDAYDAIAATYYGGYQTVQLGQ